MSRQHARPEEPDRRGRSRFRRFDRSGVEHVRERLFFREWFRISITFCHGLCRGVLRPGCTTVPWFTRSLIGDVPPGVTLSPLLELVDVVRPKFPPAFHFCLELGIGGLVVVALDDLREASHGATVAGQQRGDRLTRETSVHEEVLVDDLAELRAGLPFVVLVEDGEQSGESTSDSKVGLGVEVLNSLPGRTLQSSPERRSDKDSFVVRGGRVDALDAESVVRVVRDVAREVQTRGCQESSCICRPGGVGHLVQHVDVWSCTACPAVVGFKATEQPASLPCRFSDRHQRERDGDLLRFVASTGSAWAQCSFQFSGSLRQMRPCGTPGQAQRASGLRLQ